MTFLGELSFTETWFMALLTDAQTIVLGGNRERCAYGY